MPRERRSFLGWLILAALCLVVVGGTWMLMRQIPTPRDTPRLGPAALPDPTQDER